MRLAIDKFYVATIVVRVILVMTAATRAFRAMFNVQMYSIKVQMYFINETTFPAPYTLL